MDGAIHWRRNLTDSVKIITNLYPHQYSAKLVSFALSIVFQIIDYFLFYLKVIIINTYIGSSCKVFFDSPNDDTRFTPFSIAIFVFPTHWCHSDSDGFSNNLSRSENRAERNIVTLLAEYRE